MDKEKAKRLYSFAVSQAEAKHQRLIKWVKSLNPPETFKKMSERRFLRCYCWVVYASGFRVNIVKAKFAGLKRAFCDFDPSKLSRMDSADSALSVFNNPQKAAGFLRGAKMVHAEGYRRFKERLLSHMTSEKWGKGEKWGKPLRRLPFIGGATVRHLARDIGLADVPKDDVRVMPQRAATDAAHVAIAAVHGMSFLMTWNCVHLANAAIAKAVAGVCRQHAFECPVICTPEELLGE